MANRRFTSQFNYSLHVMPVTIDCNMAIGASGAVSDLKGPGVTSVTRLSAGIFQIKLQDNFARLYTLDASVQSPNSGSPADPNGLTTGTVYRITTVGNTDWTTAGVPAGIVPAIGVVYKQAAAPASGTGRAQPIGTSGVHSIEVVGSTDLMLAPAPVSQNIGGLITIQTLGATSSSDTTPLATDPASGSRLYVRLLLSNSSQTVQGE
jgi:hypothetical protein